MPANRLTLAAMMTALLCLLGPLTIPLGPIPLSLLTAGLMLAAMLTGPRLASLSCGVYLLLGAIGLPVLSGFQGGVAPLAGPTGGFLLGYLPMTALCGIVCRSTERICPRVLGLAGGTVLLYILGTLWYCIQAGATPAAAMTVCVLPFLPGDAFKIAAVLLLERRLKHRMKFLLR